MAIIGCPLNIALLGKKSTNGWSLLGKTCHCPISKSKVENTLHRLRSVDGEDLNLATCLGNNTLDSCGLWTHL